MKYNEPIRPAGIGRKQVAFPTGNQTSELQSLEIDFNTIANDSTGSQIEARISNAIGIAKSSATAAASDAHKKSQNYPFGMIGITDFALSGLAAITTKTLIPFRTVNVLNSNFQYDARDRMIYVNEAGWYLVQCFFYSTFRIYLHGTMGFASFLNSNTQCTLNVFKLADIFEANRLFTIPV